MVVIIKTYNGGGNYVTRIDNFNEYYSKKFSLHQNYPNPFNPKTKINYQLAITNYVKLKVYNVLGKEVATLVNQKQNAGSYSVEFNGTNYPSGIYYYKLESGNFSEVRKMILLK